MIHQKSNRGSFSSSFFKGNYPELAWIDGVYWPNAPLSQLLAPNSWRAGRDCWRRAIDPVKLRADTLHQLDEVHDAGPFTHVRLNIKPCGI